MAVRQPQTTSREQTFSMLSTSATDGIISGRKGFNSRGSSSEWGVKLT